MSEKQLAARKMTAAYPAASKSFLLALNAFLSVPINNLCGAVFNTDLFSPGLSFKNLF